MILSSTHVHTCALSLSLCPLSVSLRPSPLLLMSAIVSAVYDACKNMYDRYQAHQHTSQTVTHLLAAIRSVDAALHELQQNKLITAASSSASHQHSATCYKSSVTQMPSSRHGMLRVQQNMRSMRRRRRNNVRISTHDSTQP